MEEDNQNYLFQSFTSGHSFTDRSQRSNRPEELDPESEKREKSKAPSEEYSGVLLIIMSWF